MTEKLTIPQLAEKKRAGERLAMVAIGEFLSAQWAERAGVDIIGIGDSLGMTLHGHENTLEVTVGQMIDHCKAVRRGAPNTFTILAMPYGSYATKALAVSGVPVMGHIGLIPHQVHLMGGFKMQGRTAEAALEIIDNARAIEEAGAIGMEVEAVPYEVGKAVEDAVSIFTFSIGAGAASNCQLLNGYDLIGGFDSFKPKFAKRYANVNEVATQAFTDYVAEVKAGVFPDSDHTYQMKAEEAEKLVVALTEKE